MNAQAKERAKYQEFLENSHLLCVFDDIINNSIKIIREHNSVQNELWCKEKLYLDAYVHAESNDAIMLAFKER